MLKAHSETHEGWTGLAGKSTCVKSWLKPGMVVHTCYPSTQKVGADGSRCLGHAWLCREFKGNLGYMRVYFKMKMPALPVSSREADLSHIHTVAIQCLETAFGVTLEDSDLALPQTLPEIFEAATVSKVSLGFP